MVIFGEYVIIVLQNKEVMHDCSKEKHMLNDPAADRA
jgi:hypothetical protein